MSVRRAWLAWALCGGSALFGFTLSAQGSSDSEHWKLSGFGTLGLAWNSYERAEYLRDLSQPRGVGREVDGRMDTRLGLQANVPIADGLQATVQVVSRYRFDHTFTPDMTWAFLGWNPAPDTRLRFGRVGFDIFMDSDSRNVGYSYLWARPPVEYFGGIPVSHVDGVDFVQSFSLGRDTTLRGKAFAGWADEKTPFTDKPLNLTGGKLLGLVLEAEKGGWRGRLAHGYLRTRHEFPEPIPEMQAGLHQFALMLQDPGLDQTVDFLRIKDRKLQFSTVSMAYDRGPLQTQAVLGRFDMGKGAIPDSWCGFLSCGYRMGEVVPYALWSRGVSTRPSPYLGLLPNIPQASPLVIGVRQLALGNQVDRYTLATGLRWDLASKACLKIQAERTRMHHGVGAWHLDLGAYPQAQLQEVDGWATVLSATLDFVF